MGKFVLFAVIALIIAFTANFFGFVDIPWLDLPMEDADSHVNKGRDETRQMIEEIDKNQ